MHNITILDNDSWCSNDNDVAGRWKGRKWRVSKKYVSCIMSVITLQYTWNSYSTKEKGVGEKVIHMLSRDSTLHAYFVEVTSSILEDTGWKRIYICYADLAADFLLDLTPGKVHPFMNRVLGVTTLIKTRRYYYTVRFFSSASHGESRLSKDKVMRADSIWKLSLSRGCPFFMVNAV